jgi:hypothetical protein
MSKIVLENVNQMRAAMADGLEARNIGGAAWRHDIREGRRDDTPFMVGALIMAQVQALAQKAA